MSVVPAPAAVFSGIVLAGLLAGCAAPYLSRIETEGIDPVTQDMVIDILHDEQGHRRLFEGFLREYEAEGLA